MSPAVECAESSLRLRRYADPEHVQALAAAAPDYIDGRVELYGALASSLVWVTEGELMLGDSGPEFELRPQSTIAGRVLAIYTEPQRAPQGGLHGVPIAFAELVRGLDRDVTLLVDPSDPDGQLTVWPAHLEVLRGALQPDDLASAA